MEEDDHQDEIISTRKFFFQQRRGSLDIRNLARIDIEAIIKDVDIDTLQSFLENITFSNITQNELKYLTDPLILKFFQVAQLLIEYLLYAQEELIRKVENISKKYAKKKRHIILQRREIHVLHESVDSLREQVNIKRQNIKTLEILLKEASKKRFKKSIVRTSNDHGRDTEEEREEEIPKQRRNYTENKSTQSSPKSLTKSITRESAAANINGPIENVPAAIPQTAGNQGPKGDLDLFIFMTEKWNRLEASLRGQMEEYISVNERKAEEQRNVKFKPRLVFGDLEDDFDSSEKKETTLQISPAIKPYNSIKETQVNVERVEATTTEIYELEKLLQEKESIIKDLKKEMYGKDFLSADRREFFHVTDSGSEPVAVELVESRPLDEAPFMSRSAAYEDVEEVYDNSILQSSVEPLEIEAPNDSRNLGDYQMKSIDEENIPIVSSYSSVNKSDLDDDASIEEIGEVSTTPDNLDATVEDISFPSIVFKARDNPDLLAYGVEQLIIDCGGRIDNSSNKERIVFELRRSIADQLSLPLTQVALLFDEQVVTIGIDIDGKFDMMDAAAACSAGRLTLQVQRGEVVSDAQLESLVDAWGDALESTSSADMYGDELRGSGKWNSLLRSVDDNVVVKSAMSSLASSTREYDDIIGNDDEEYDQLQAYKDFLRASIPPGHSSDNEIASATRMSSREYENKMSALDGRRQQMPENISTHMSERKREIGAKVVQEALLLRDSGNWDVDGGRAPIVSVSLSQSLSNIGNQPNEPSLVLHRMSRVYDEASSAEASEDDGDDQWRMNDHADFEDPNSLSRSFPTISSSATSIHRHHSRKKPKSMRYDGVVEDDSLYTVDGEDASRSEAKASADPMDLPSDDEKGTRRAYLERKHSGILVSSSQSSTGMAAELRDAEEREADEKRFLSSTRWTDTTVSAADWNRTFDSNGDMIPIEGDPLHDADVRRRADEYERRAALDILNSSSQSLVGITEFTTTVSSGTHHFSTGSSAPFLSLQPTQLDDGTSDLHSLMFTASSDDLSYPPPSRRP